MANDSKSRETRQRLERCWNEDLDWDLLPAELREVHVNVLVEVINLGMAVQ